MGTGANSEVFTLTPLVCTDSTGSPRTFQGLYKDSLPSTWEVIWQETPAKSYQDSTGSLVGGFCKVQGVYREVQGVPVQGLSRDCLESLWTPYYFGQKCRV